MSEDIGKVFAFSNSPINENNENVKIGIYKGYDEFSGFNSADVNGLSSIWKYRIPLKDWEDMKKQHIKKGLEIVEFLKTMKDD